MLRKLEAIWQPHLVRYAANGLVATSVHFCVLQVNLKMLDMTSAGLANFIAACFGIIVSFVGNRYFVFRAYQRSIMHQFSKFGGLYTAIALLHGAALYGWSDLLGWDYRTGFLIATLLQIIFSYWGNKLLVFDK
jgi:putative flippase GtrA